MKILLGIVMIYNLVNILFSYIRYKKNLLTKGTVANLLFSFFLYANIFVSLHIEHNSSCFTLGIAICWLISHIIVNVAAKFAVTVKQGDDL